MSENLEIFVGIDIAKDTLDMGFQPSGRPSGSHDAQGITEATKRLGEAALCLVVLETTGGLETPLGAALVAAGVPVAVVNPRQVRDYAKATGQLAKTDRIDALGLADFARAIRPELRPATTMRPHVPSSRGSLGSSGKAATPLQGTEGPWKLLRPETPYGSTAVLGHDRRIT